MVSEVGSPEKLSSYYSHYDKYVLYPFLTVTICYENILILYSQLSSHVDESLCTFAVYYVLDLILALYTIKFEILLQRLNEHIFL